MFIESVRARATCNTIISSHPVSSHRPCTLAQLFPLLCSRVSFPFLADFFPPIPVHSLSSLYSLSFFFYTVSSGFPSSRQYAFSYQPCLFVRSLDLVFPPLAPRSSVFSLFSPALSFCFHPFPHPRVFVSSPVLASSLYTLSPVFTTSIQSYLI